MPRPAKKKTRVLAKAQRLGELQADLEHEAKTFTNKKQLMVSIKNHLGKLIDRVDPLKMMAIIGATIVIKRGIDWLEILGQKWSETSTRGPVGIVASILGDLLPDNPVLEALAGRVEGKKVNLGTEAEIMEWLISFTLAYLIVEHAGELINAGGSLLFTAKGLLGGGVTGGGVVTG